MKMAMAMFNAVDNPLKLSNDQSGGCMVAVGDGTASAASSSTSRSVLSITVLPTRST